MLPDEALSAHFPDAVAAYERCVADAEYARAQWVKSRRPLVQANGNGTNGVHPLLKSLHDCEALAARLRSELGLSPKSAKTVIHRRPGRPVGAVSAADRVEPPPLLRVAKRSAG